MKNGKTILVMLIMILGIFLILDGNKESKRKITFINEKIEVLIGAALLTFGGFWLFKYKV